ncbi:MAG: hypothetical protein HETSPECPRED_008583 [Heterodermia speciosa]|uniref:Lipocalin-like domain-containing protein n=1 Tax=Heterodermia speciosa TaxID=116794 RepID=A0A8H3FYE5_9LECA|nr:MAG: hypothetical protein HETSPECPRED_008583 [Heterodermia speciosa]
MAAPPSKTLKDLNGKWVMNKTLSDDTDAILAMQNVSWFLRKAIAFATITLSITEYTKDGSTHIDISQTATGGVKGTTELRTLDWTFRDHKDGIFGEVKGKSRWVKVEDLEDDDDKKWLSHGWDDGGEGEHVQSYVESVGGGWTANQVS